MTFYPAITNRTRATTQRSSSCFIAAIYAMLCIFCGGSKRPPVNFLMTLNTNGHSIIDVKGKLREICKRFYVMCVYIAAFLAANFARIIISFINGLPPCFKTALEFAACCFGRFPTLPYWRRITSSPFEYALLRAESSAMVNCIKFFSTRITVFHKWDSSIRPAPFRAKLGRGFTIFFNKIKLAAYGAIEGDSSIFHDGNYTTYHKLSPAYVAVALQRYQDAFGITPELIQ